jgi:YaiO family outer membrane protein
MKKAALFAVLVLGLLFISPRSLSAQAREAAVEKASRAIAAGDYAEAVRACLDQLRSDPGDYELNLLLGRARAFSGQWDEALRIMNKMAAAYPGNADVLLFRARIESWKKNYRAAVDGYQEVLAGNPGNTEAMTGLAEVASWQGDYNKAISIYAQVRERRPDDADIYFRLGRVHLWDGNYAAARDYYRRARDHDSKNIEYQRALKTASPRWQDKFELRYEHQNESFSDGRTDYVDQRLALQLKLWPGGPLVLKANTTDRFAGKDYQYALEFYPPLWRHAYAYIDAAYSPRAVHFPETLFLGEIYQSLSSSWEVSLGYRRMNFSDQSVNILLGSIGRYIGRYIAFFRWYYTPDGEGEAFSWTANLRRYFADSSYVYAAYGRGSKPYDIVTLEDFKISHSWVFFAGFDWYFFRHIKLQLNYTHREERELRRNLLYLGAGYRW